MNYNIIRKDISNGLKGKQISSLGQGNYLILRHAPTLANVRIQLDNNNAPYIDMIENDTIQGTGFKNVYITADAVPGEHITFAQASTSKDFKIIPAAALKQVVVDGLYSFIPKLDQKQTILAGASYTLDTTALTGIRFLSTDTVDVALNGSAINYPMLEDEIYTRDINSLKFTNNTAASIDIVIWEM